MRRKLLYSIRSLFNGNGASSNNICCYHCGEYSTPRRTIYVQFDGTSRAVCCNGCAAILGTIEEFGMSEEYLAHKIQIHDNQK